MKNTVRNFRTDLIFKFAFSNSENQESMYLLKQLIESIIFRHVGRLDILNPELLKVSPTEKGVRYDIKAKDELGNRYEIEMQNTSLTKTQIKRFGYYGAKLVNGNMIIGDDYSQLKQNIQIILIDYMNEEKQSLVECFQSRNKKGEEEGKEVFNNEQEYLMLRYYIYMPIINEIVKEKGIRNLSDFEAMIYVIYNGIDEELRTRKVVRIMEKILKRVNQSQVLSDMEYARKVYLATEQEEKDEYYEMGERKGIEQERINSIISFCHLKYPRRNFM